MTLVTDPKIKRESGSNGYGRPGVRPRVAVVGGGITGLAAAHRLVELGAAVDVKLLESGSRLGGVLESVRKDGFLLECGADNFITNTPGAIDLCRRIGFEDQLIPTNAGLRQAFVVRKGKLHRIPDGFVVMAPSKIWPMITTPILSPLGKLRLGWEYFVRPKMNETDESLASFAIRRFGREVYDRLIQPLVGGIYASNPNQLSLQAALPRFVEMERVHGSLIRGVLHGQAKRQQQTAPGSGAPYSLFVAPRNGMSALVEAIVARLPEGIVQLNSLVDGIARNPRGSWSLSLSGGRSKVLNADAVIVAMPARRASEILSPVDHELSSRLAKISYSSSAIVSLGYERQQIAHSLDGFGFVVPIAERRGILSGSLSSIKYPGRAPAGSVLVRVFVGGPTLPDAGHLSDKDLSSIAIDELRRLLKIQGQPILQHIIRHHEAMPQYLLGHGENIREIETQTSRLPGLELAGNAYHGIGIPACIQSGEQAAERVLDQLGVSRSPHRTSVDIAMQ
jgi:oxygen-dependent protoporphyrinogen oxidase